jgi:DNA repair protein RecO (recombination protein O)
MEWTDEAIVLGSRRHGETSAIVELMTAAHGRHLGLMRGGASRRHAAMLQAGNGVRATWRARLDEHLGYYALEPTRLCTDRLMASGQASFGIQTLAALVRLLPERDPHENIFHALAALIEELDSGRAAPALVRFELDLLAELGFGLDLAACAATGVTGELVYVSPKSGRAVSRDAGERWKDQLLALPRFLSGEAEASGEEIAAGFALTGFFLTRRVYEPRGLELPDVRAALIAALARAA